MGELKNLQFNMMELLIWHL